MSILHVFFLLLGNVATTTVTAFQNSPISSTGAAEGWTPLIRSSSSSYPTRTKYHPYSNRRTLHLDWRRQRQSILVSDLFIDEFLVHEQEAGGHPSSVDHVVRRDDTKVPMQPTEERQRQRRQDQKQDQNEKPVSNEGLRTSVGGRLVRDFGITNPMDRMALTSSGTLQKLVSAYYDSTVSATVEHNQEQEDNPGYWDRIVRMSVLDNQITFCSATSKVHVLDKECNDMLKSGKIGLGQLFDHYGVQPMFRLLDAGYRENDGGLWRVYELTCDNLIVCCIREDFVPGLWSLSSSSLSSTAISSCE